MLNFDLFERWIPLFESLHNQKLSEKALIMFYESIKGFSDDNFDDLCKEIYKNEEFMPKPATFFRYYRKRLEDQLDSWWPAILKSASHSLPIDHFPSSIKFALNSFSWMKACRESDERSIAALKAKIVGLMAEYDPDRHQKLLPESSPQPQAVSGEFNGEGIQYLSELAHKYANKPYKKPVSVDSDNVIRKQTLNPKKQGLTPISVHIDQFIDEKVGF